MVKMALFCPRLPREAEGSWQLRQQACRLYIRQFNNVDILEFDTLENLQVQYRRHAFRRVLVAQSGYYPLDFWEWTGHQRIDVFDVLMRPEQATPEPETLAKVTEQEPLSNSANCKEKEVPVPRRARYIPLVQRREMRGPRYITRQY